MRTILLVLCILSITFSTRAQLLGKRWAPGKYYDVSGRKHAGLLSWSAPANKIYFKNDYNDSLQVKVPSIEIRSFILGTDSFVVSAHKDLLQTPFLALSINTPIKLYKSITVRSSPMGGVSGMGSSLTMNVGGIYGGTDFEYYYGTDPDNINKLGRKNFVEVISKIMADTPEAVARVKSKIYRYGDLDDLIAFYKRQHPNLK